MNKRAILGLVLILLCIGLPAAWAAPPAKSPQPVSTAALVPPGDPSQGAVPLDVTTLSTDFEPAEGAPPGFAPGYCAQNGWTAFTASAVEGQISAANPYSGAQHVRVAGDPAVSVGERVGCFSPDIGPQPVQPNSLSVQVAISGQGGADYFVNPQAPSQDFTTARVDFEFRGNIWVLDDPGGGLAMVDTGVAWNVGPYTRLDIVVDPVGNTIRYYYGGTLIYTGVVFAGTTIEQVVLYSDNYHMGDVGDFDTLQAQVDPTSIRLADFESPSAAAWPIGVALVAMLVLGGAFGIRVKRSAAGR
jgi:hypothetical protein